MLQRLTRLGALSVVISGSPSVPFDFYSSAPIATSGAQCRFRRSCISFSFYALHRSITFSMPAHPPAQFCFLSLTHFLFDLRDVFSLRLPYGWDSSLQLFPPLCVDCVSFVFPTLCRRVLPTFAFLFNLVPLFACSTLRMFLSACRDAFGQRTKYPGSIILLTAWADILVPCRSELPIFSHTGATVTFLTTRQLCYSSRSVNTFLADQILLRSLISVYRPGLLFLLRWSSDGDLNISFFTNVSPMLGSTCCPKYAARGLVPLFTNSACVNLYASEVS
jgi:hypothetical protein